MKQLPSDDGRIIIELDERETDMIDTLRDKYRTSTVSFLEMVLAYYFGDGANHLHCELCPLENHTKRKAS